MSKTIKLILNIIKYLVFISLGVFLFMAVTKEYMFKELIDQLLNFNMIYIVIAIIFSIISNISRAIRWNMLLEPMNFKMNLFNAFLSINVMYLVNLFLPRAGEVARCGYLAKTDKIPFPKLVGTMLIERAADALTLFILTFIVLITQTSVFKEFFADNPGTSEKISGIFTTTRIIIGFFLIALFVISLIIFRKKFKHTIIYKKLSEFYHSLAEGVKAIFKLKRPYLFIVHTLFIYLMWFLMLFTFLKGFGPTEEFGMTAVLLIFVMSSLSMIVPVPAGIGAFHFTVASVLVLYGIGFNEGVSFAFIMHTSINLYLDMFGLLAFLYFLYLIFIKSKNNTRAEKLAV